MADRQPIRVLTYNVHSCIGLDGRHDPARIADVIAREQADVAVLQELDQGRRRSGRLDQPAFLAERTGMTALFAEAWTGYGIAVLSRLPARLVCRAPLPSVRGLGPIVERRMAIWVDLEIADARLSLFGTHLGLLPHERERQIDALVGGAWLGALGPNEPCVLLGDLNTRPGSRLFRRLLGGDVLRDACVAVPDGPRATFPSPRPFVRLDHVLFAGAVRPVAARVPRDALARRASDHLPLVVDLEV